MRKWGRWNRRGTFVACGLLGLLGLNCGDDGQTTTSKGSSGSTNSSSGSPGGNGGSAGNAGSGNGGEAGTGGGAGAGGSAGAGGGSGGGIPVLNAPPLDPTVPGTFVEEITFIYTGPDAVQQGVDPATFDEAHIAVIRGRALDRTGAAVPGVRISITGHPEYGFTKTRADGWFDMAVNGGDRLVVHYEHPDYLPVDRKLKTPWNDWVIANEVVLTPLDSNVTAIDFGANTYQIAKGSTVTDQDGTRQVTMLFQPMTKASLVMADGMQKDAATLHMRATEFTVGNTGPNAMPADLPPTTGYTFAAELSADEAMAQGAKSVQFDKTVFVYLDNFISIPVGEIVPSGTYQYDTGEWVASENGAVIKILDVTGGIATIDATGDDLADTPAELMARGFTDGERTQLASLYSAGTEVWRVPIAHMTPYDFNFGETLPNDAEAAPTNSEKDPRTECMGTQKPGASVIGCRGQTITEQIPIADTPYSLVYSSNRALGYTDQVVIPVTTATPPASLLRAEVTIYIAGEKIVKPFSNLPNQSYTFTWNGRDTYGRPVGSALASVETRYFYRPVYVGVGAFAFAFAKFGLAVTPLFRNGNPLLARNEFSIVSAFTVPMGIPSSPAGLGAWNVDVHHVYDPISKELVRGDGSRKSATELGTRTVRHLAWPTWYNSMTPQVAAKAAPDGSIWILGTNPTLMHVDTSGVLTTFSVPAECVTAYSLAVANNQKIFIGCDNPTNGPGVWKINPGQNAQLIAGGHGNLTGNYYDPMEAGEGVPAVDAKLSPPYSLAVAPDGSLYVAGYAHIRKIHTDGIITTIADDQDLFGDPLYAHKATEVYGYPKLATGPDGSLYFTNQYHVTQVRPNGSPRIIAGAGLGMNGEEPPPGLPLPGQGLSVNATLIGIRVDNVAVSSIGLVYLHGQTINGNRGYIMEVRPDGTASMYAGTGTNVLSVPSPADFAHVGPPIPAYDSNILSAVDSFTFLPNDSLFWLQSALPTSSVPYLLGPAFEPGMTGSATNIAIADHGVIEIFDRRGRHLRTEHPLTGATLQSFGYDAAGHLEKITDAGGLMTQFTRSMAGDQVTITAPHGQTTQLAMNPQGWLKTVSNPLGETHSMTYEPPDSGLLESITNPRNFKGTMTYNAEGRLETDTDATNAIQSLARVVIAGGDLVRHTSGEGRITEYTNTRTANDDALTIDRGQGQVEKTTKYQDQSSRSTSADGVITTQTLQQDPRFGLSEPILRQRVTKMPSGLSSTESFTRTVTLTDPADIKSLAMQIDTMTINGHSTVSTYQATDHSVSIVTSEGRTSKQTIDDKGRLLSIELPGILPIAFQYDAQGRLHTTTQGTRVYTLDYDAQGRLSSSTNALMHKTQMGYDGAGRITSATLPDMKNMTFTYDTMGNMMSLTPPDKPAHGFSWTPIDQAATYTPPMVIPGGNTTYGYDKDRLLTGETLPTGAIDSIYDATKRLRAVMVGADAMTIDYVPNTSNVSSVSHSGGVDLAYTYDGSLPLTETYSGNVSGTVTKTYDQDFRVASSKVNALGPISYAYDNDGLLKQAGDLAVTYAPDNGLLMGTTAGTITTTYQYDSYGDVSTYTAKASAAEVFKCDYTRDTLGRIAQKFETIGGVTTTYAYQYDNRERLTQVKRNGSVTHTYTYDGNGNRLSETTSGTVMGTYDAQDRIATYGNTTYVYNANGQWTQKTVGAAITGYNYDLLGNLRQVNLPDGRVLKYEVDGRNRRVGKRINGTLMQGFLYDGQLRPIAELDGAGAVVSQFVYALHANVPELILKGGSTYRVITDHLGSPRLVVDTATNAIVQRMDYDAFGKVEQDTNPGFQPFGFAGGLYDADTKLVRFGARDYDAETGRWTAKDPLQFGGGDSNLYGYAFGDPVNFVDPSGRVPVLLVVGAVVVTVALVLPTILTAIDSAHQLDIDRRNFERAACDPLNDGGQNLTQLRAQHGRSTQRAGARIAEAARNIPGTSLGGTPVTSDIDVVVNAFHTTWTTHYGTGTGPNP